MNKVKELNSAPVSSVTSRDTTTVNSSYPKLRNAGVGRFSCAFLPSPHSYLKLSQVKSLINCAYYSDQYRGELVIRIDDSGDPGKCSALFENGILQDLKILGITPDRITHSSDHFIACEQMAEELIKLGRAYMDFGPSNKVLLNGFNPSCRGRPPEESLHLFRMMCVGQLKENNPVLRARANMNIDTLNVSRSAETLMVNDPIIYMYGNAQLHYRTGQCFWAYPTPNFARPILDAIEGITHYFVSTEEDDSFYFWIQRALQLRPVTISTFGKIEVVDTVMKPSQGTDASSSSSEVVVIDDSHYLTLRDLIRRGMSMGPLRSHLLSLGASKRVTQIKWDSMWSANRKFLEPLAPRFMAIRSKGCVKMSVARIPNGVTSLTIPMHPRNAEAGERTLHVSDTVILDAQDAESIEEGEEVTLLRWTSVMITCIHRSPSTGTPLSLESEFLPVFKFLKKKKAVTWLASRPDLVPLKLVQFGPLQVTTEGDERSSTNKRSTVCVDALGDPALCSLKESNIIQLERLGFFRVDVPFTNFHEPMVLFMIPDGKNKNKHCSLDPKCPATTY